MLTGRPEAFTHGNMQPFFGGSIKQDTRVGEPSSFLSRYTGVQSQGEAADAPKREITPMFEARPEEIWGNAGAPDLFKSRMEAPRLRNNELPFEQERVGPGLNRGFGTSGTKDGLLSERTFAMPLDTDAIRTVLNPKLTYTGVVVPGAPRIATAPTSERLGSIENRMPERFTEYQPGEGLFTTVGAVTSATARPEEIIRETTRPSTHRPYIGAVRPTLAPDAMANAAVASAVRASTQAQLREPNVGPRVRIGTGTGDCSDYGRRNMAVYANERDLTQSRTYQGNVAAVVKALTAPLLDLVRAPARDAGKCAAPRSAGNVGGVVVRPTTYDPSDVLRTTIREQTVDAVWTTGAALGGVAGPRKMSVYDPLAHAARVTLKQQIVADAQRLGGGIGSVLRGGAVPKPPVYDPLVHAPRTTLKEQIVSDAQVHAGGGVLTGGAVPRATVYDPLLHAPRTTIKEQNVGDHDGSDGVLTGGAVPRATVYDPLRHAPRTTLKEQDVGRQAAGGGGTLTGGAVPRARIYDPAVHAPRTTIKEQNVGDHDGGDGMLTGGAVPRATVYDPLRHAPRTTLKEQIVSDAQAHGGAGMLTGGKVPRATVYDPTLHAPRTTMKEQRVGDHDGSDGVLTGGAVPRATVYDPTLHAPRTTMKEQGIADGAGAEWGTVAPSQYEGYSRDPLEVAKPTGRQTLPLVDTSINLVPTDRPHAAPARAADGSDVLARTTLKEQFSVARGDGTTDGTSVGGLIGTGAYQTANYVAQTTLSDLALPRGEGYVGGVNSSTMTAGDGYRVAMEASVPRDTSRQVLSDVEYFGSARAADGADGETSRDNYRNADVRDPGREMLLHGRTPTLSGVKSVAGLESVQSLDVRHQDMTAAAEWTPPVGRPATSLPAGAALDNTTDAGSITVDKMVYRNQSDRLDDDVRAVRVQVQNNPVALQQWDR